MQLREVALTELTGQGAPPMVTEMASGMAVPSMQSSSPPRVLKRCG